MRACRPTCLHEKALADLFPHLSIYIGIPAASIKLPVRTQLLFHCPIRRRIESEDILPLIIRWNVRYKTGDSGLSLWEEEDGSSLVDISRLVQLLLRRTYGFIVKAVFKYPSIQQRANMIVIIHCVNQNYKVRTQLIGFQSLRKAHNGKIEGQFLVRSS